MQNQNSSIWVEREREQIFLQGALDALRSLNGHAPQAIFITGPEGSGRSSLLTWVARQVRQSIQFATFAFSWPARSSGLPALASLLGQDDTSPLYPYLANYRDALARASELEQRVEQIQLGLGLPDLKKLAWGNQFEEGRFRVVQALPPKALHFLLRRLYSIYSPSQLSEQAAAFIKTGLEDIIQLNATNLGQLRAFVDEDLRPQFSETEWQAYLKPDESLVQGLASSLNSYVEKERPLVLLFDDYQASENDRLLRQVIESSHSTLWLFAGKQRPAWSDKLEQVKELPLEALTAQGLASYFEKKYGRSLAAQEAQWLIERTVGLPLLVTLVADLYTNGNGVSAADLDAAAGRTVNDPLTGLFLYFIEESGRLSEAERKHLYTLAILRQPTSPEFLEAFEQAVKTASFSYDPALTSTLFESYPWLAEQSQQQLHPALQERLRHYLMVERLRFSQPIQEGILEPARNVAVAQLQACEERLVAEPEEQGSLRARARDAAWGEAVADTAYYRLWLDEALGWVSLLPRWVMALAYNRPLARHLLAVAQSMQPTFYTEGTDLLPCLQTILSDSYTMGRKGLEEKLSALDKLETLGTNGRMRWFKAENLGLRPAGKGSAEAELRGILSWEKALVQEEAGQFEKAAPLYEAVLATNVEMPELKLAAAHSALYLALRYRLRGAAESAYSALYRAAELNDQQHNGIVALFWQALKVTRYDTALKAADVLSDLNDPQAQLLMIFALYALDRKPEALTEARTLTARPGSEKQASRAVLLALVRFAGLADDTPELAAILNELPG